MIFGSEWSPRNVNVRLYLCSFWLRKEPEKCRCGLSLCIFSSKCASNITSGIRDVGAPRATKPSVISTELKWPHSRTPGRSSDFDHQWSQPWSGGHVKRGGGDVSVTSDELMLVLKMNNCFDVVSIVTLKSDFRSRAMQWRAGGGQEKSILISV